MHRLVTEPPTRCPDGYVANPSGRQSRARWALVLALALSFLSPWVRWRCCPLWSWPCRPPLTPVEGPLPCFRLLQPRRQEQSAGGQGEAARGRPKHLATRQFRECFGLGIVARIVHRLCSHVLLTVAACQIRRRLYPYSVRSTPVEDAGVFTGFAPRTGRTACPPCAALSAKLCGTDFRRLAFMSGLGAGGLCPWVGWVLEEALSACLGNATQIAIGRGRTGSWDGRAGGRTTTCTAQACRPITALSNAARGFARALHRRSGGRAWRRRADEVRRAIARGELVAVRRPGGSASKARSWRFAAQAAQTPLPAGRACHAAPPPPDQAFASLPAPLSSFIGREVRARAALMALLV